MFDRHFNTFLNEGTTLDIDRNAVQIIAIVNMILVQSRQTGSEKPPQQTLNVFYATDLTSKLIPIRVFNVPTL